MPSGGRARVLLALILACLGALTWGVASAYSWVNFTWIQGVTMGPAYDILDPNLVGTSGFGPRDHIQVWRPVGYETDVQYENTSGGIIAQATNAADNPFYWDHSTSYAKAWCGDLSAGGNEVHPYTCQTTNPS